MPITTPTQLIKDMQQLNPKESIFVLYWNKDDINEAFCEEFSGGEEPLIEELIEGIEMKNKSLPKEVIRRVYEGITEGEFWEQITSNINYDLNKWLDEKRKENQLKEVPKEEEELWKE